MPLYSLKNKRVLIYGSGVWCRRLIDSLKDTAVLVGILDKEKTAGEIQGVPILTWGDIRQGVADAVIIASRPQFYKEIYIRIASHCLKLGLEIYSADGQKLRQEYGKPAVNIENALYYAKTKDSLLKKIREYDAVSFDVFDTLMMRRTLEPSDIFLLVEERLQKKGINAMGFKTKRIEAEQSLGLLGGGNITLDGIYNVIKSRMNLDDETCRIMKKEELLCEKENLVPRRAMLDVFHSALEQGKIVNLISDMYIPEDILAGFLEGFGISGYRRLYVSCDCGMSKQEGLFAVYRKDVEGLRCLHIGDSYISDVLAPQKYGIDSFEIWSAYKMLENSSLSSILCYAASLSDRLFLGHFISDVLNDPFALHEYAGAVQIQTIEQFASFFMPVLLLYLDGLCKLLDTGRFDTVLFSARDFYLVKKIYDAEILYPRKKNVRSVYFLTSRRLTLKAAFYDIENIVSYAGYINNPEVFSAHLNRVYDSEVSHTAGKALHIAFDEIKKESCRTRENYLKYMQRNDLHLNRSCLFCELISEGTNHFYLNGLMHTDMEGLYLGTGPQFPKRKLTVTSYYCNWFLRDSDAGLLHIMEKILTAPDPSITDMDSDGNPVYNKEFRNEAEIEELVAVQDAILSLIGKTGKHYSAFGCFSPAFAREFIELCSAALLPSELQPVFAYDAPDDLVPQTLGLLPMHFSD